MFNAKVIPILIASPSDVPEEREIVRDTIYGVNYTESFRNELVLLPIGWETHSSPELGIAPQDQINERLVDRCDILVGVFWTKIGSPTQKEVSGSVEEIKRHHEAGKPALLFFCEKPVAPQMLDAEQYAALTEFKEWCQPLGLYQPFSDGADLKSQLDRTLRITLHENSYLAEEMARFDVIKEQREEGLTTVGFPQMAVDMLNASAAGNGMVMMRDYLGGSSVHAGTFSVETSGSGKEDAEVRGAIEKLENYGLIEERNFGSGIYFVTSQGYEAVENNDEAVSLD